MSLRLSSLTLHQVAIGVLAVAFPTATVPILAARLVRLLLLDVQILVAPLRTASNQTPVQHFAKMIIFLLFLGG